MSWDSGPLCDSFGQRLLPTPDGHGALGNGSVASVVPSVMLLVHWHQESPLLFPPTSSSGSVSRSPTESSSEFRRRAV